MLAGVASPSCHSSGKAGVQVLPGIVGTKNFSPLRILANPVACREMVPEPVEGTERGQPNGDPLFDKSDFIVKEAASLTSCRDLLSRVACEIQKPSGRGLATAFR